ncbi:PepSY domain-containing protein [Microbulbifer thermotolerans]|uniref:PepSY domain-containing protein n=1 Tax=Microbulbifer thermotolerans TaxID=252514 RepID=A0AB35HYG6_MICTH|nr:PepSY-associated TM helix domain-containing protein [Microbulbifer thermotolerans]MCX2781656.1 PepSY domain-containing protein [Microbulbifer thermotolerans]MCX2801602.1 PepSY domain-containing protein [Microbulbifer thermotolerans]MCX2835354.1 PepSY domain-containing protein [Microbulbifer thermotolerans]MCX2840711.1 PepSY domain-containing protein [Microbulbifer thermotolerans]
MRRVFFILHKYAGLTLGLLLSVIGITGSLLVFDHALDEKLAPETVTFKPSQHPASYTEILAAAQAAVPGNPEPTRLMTPRQPGSPFVVRFPKPEGAPGPIEVSVSPTDAEVLAVRGWGEYPMTWIYRLHYTLLAGDTGKKIVGFMGIALILFCISGLAIWWPRPSRNGKRWKRAFTIKRDGNRFRFYFDIHKVFGIYLLPVLLVVAFSGVTIVFPLQVEKLVGWVMPLEPRGVWGQSESTGAPPLDPDSAVAIGRKIFPQGELKRIYLPLDASDSYGLTFRQDGEPWTNHGTSFIRIDQYSGNILMVYDFNELPAGNQFLAWQFPLHNGDALGLFGRWLVLIAGLSPALLFTTGIYLWWKKRRPTKLTKRSVIALFTSS